MKIITNINGSKKAYIQIRSAQQMKKQKLNLLSVNIPEYSIKDTLLKKGENPADFIEVTSEKDIKTIEETTWVIDFEYLMSKSTDTLNDYFELINLKIEDLSDEIKLDPRKLKSNHLILEKIILLEQQKEDIKQVLSYKKGRKDIPVPSIPDYKKSSVISDNYLFEMNFSLRQNEIIITRRDTKPFLQTTNLSKEFIRKCIALGACEYSDLDSKLTNFKLETSISEDKMSLIIKFVPITHSKKIIPFLNQSPKLSLKTTLDTQIKK